MMSLRTELYLAPSLAFLAGLLLPISTMAQSVPYPVAVGGTPAPSGGTYQLFFLPTINASGTVAFAANTSGSGTGIFVGTPGSPLTTAALVGTAAPAGGNYTGLNTPVLNNSGQVAFAANVSSAGAGIYAGTPGSPLTTVALKGSAAPAGGNYTGFYEPVFTNSGQVAFSSTLSVAGSGMFAGTPGSPLTTVALQGTAAPAGGNYSGPISSYVMNASGQVAFRTSLSSPSGEAIFAGTPGTPLTTVALNGILPGGGGYSMSNPVINSSGQVAVGGGIPSGEAIFVGTPGTPLSIVAKSGDPAPIGGNFSGFNATSTALNASGRVAFLAGVGSGEGFFTGYVGGPIKSIAFTGDVAPGTGGAIYTTWTKPSIALNNFGQAAFLAVLSGPTATNQGLFAGTPGNIVLVVRKGDVIDVDPTAGVDNRVVLSINLRTEYSGENGQISTFNDSGILTYQLMFTDGSTGVFISSIAVPEPGTIALLSGTAALAALGVWRYRRKQHQLMNENLNS